MALEKYAQFLHHLVCAQSIINEPIKKYLKLISEGKKKKKNGGKKPTPLYILLKY